MRKTAVGMANSRARAGCGYGLVLAALLTLCVEFALAETARPVPSVDAPRASLPLEFPWRAWRLFSSNDHLPNNLAYAIAQRSMPDSAMALPDTTVQVGKEWRYPECAVFTLSVHCSLAQISRCGQARMASACFACEAARSNRYRVSQGRPASYTHWRLMANAASGPLPMVALRVAWLMDAACSSRCAASACAKY